MNFPVTGAKLTSNLAQYAQKQGLKYADIKLKDGTSLRILDNRDLVLDNPKLPSAVSLFHINDSDKLVLGSKSCMGSDNRVIAFLVENFKKLQELSKSKDDLFEQMLDQFFDKTIMPR